MFIRITNALLECSFLKEDIPLASPTPEDSLHVEYCKPKVSQQMV